MLKLNFILFELFSLMYAVWFIYSAKFSLRNQYYALYDYVKDIDALNVMNTNGSSTKKISCYNMQLLYHDLISCYRLCDM